MVNPKKLPLKQAKDIQTALKALRAHVAKNPEYIKASEVQTSWFRIEDTDISSGFYFEVKDCSQNANLKSIFTLEIFPFNDTQLKTQSISVELSTINANFERWLTIIKEYSTIELSAEDEYIKSYEEEFYQKLNILPEDDQFRLTIPEQNRVFLLLANIQRLLIEDSDMEEANALFLEVKDLEENIPKQPKKAIGNRLAKILAKMWYKSIGFGKTAISMAAKEGFKEVVKKGIDHAYNHRQEIWSLLTDLFKQSS